MNKIEIINKLKEIAKERKTKIEEQNLNKSFKELGIDSLSAISMIVDVEEKFKITLPDDDLMKIKNFEELIQVINKVLEKK
ncbi:MAG: phosphopantetheine-binding protein [Mycoplasmataceae bacterium]|jgi:acyl carrier protein|nr:phosphopantetheine-binding protein [Mycoplasmataceae bacterium]